MKTTILILVLASLVFSMPYTVLANGYTNISVTEAKTMIHFNPSLAILDVRSQSEYNSGHIRNAKLIPHTELAGRLNELNETDEILVYCLSGGRSATASQILVDNGFLYVYNMLGGITAWKNEGYTVYIKYSSIQEAINNAGEGDTIFASSGTYYENIVANKTVSLIGENRNNTIIDGNFSGTVVTVTADNVSITGFTIQKSQESGVPTFSGIYISSNGNNISSITLTNNTSGFYLYNSSNNTISCNAISNNNQAILLDHSSNNNVLTGNNASHNNRGIQLMYSCHYNTISNNTVSNNNDYGIILEYECHNNSLFHNTVSNNNDTGILLVTSNNNTIFHNNFINNTQQTYIVDSTNIWDNGCEGNFWSNYNGTDLDGDGIGDTYLPWEGVDSYPLVNLYWSPADVDHDLDVDLYDAVKLLICYGSEQGDPEYNPHCDIAEPYGQIDLYDAVLLLVNYGKKYS